MAGQQALISLLPAAAWDPTINIGASIAVFTGAVFGVLGIDTIEHFAMTVQSAVFALVLISNESKTQAPASYADFTNTSLQ